MDDAYPLESSNVFDRIVSTPGKCRGDQFSYFLCLTFHERPRTPVQAGVDKHWYYQCAPCHGDSGRGDGPAADLYWPPPRNFWDEPLRMGSTSKEIRSVISNGLPGTGMPGFKEALSPQTIDGLTLRIVEWAQKRTNFERTLTDDMAATTSSPNETGGVLWRTQGCSGCHGENGQGDGPLAAHLKNLDGTPSDLYDLHGPLKGGDSVEAIVRAIAHGRPGTLMLPRPDLSTDERRALADYIQRLRAVARPTKPRRIPKKRPKRAKESLWVFGTGELDAGLRSDCKSCHPSQHVSFMTSRHAHARGPGVVGQYAHMSTSAIQSCDQCHAPIKVGYAGVTSHGDGLTCSSCHLHSEHTISPTAGAHPSQSHLPNLKQESRMKRGDFCLPCHSLPLSKRQRSAPLDTWREWASTTYLRWASMPRLSHEERRSC